MPSNAVKRVSGLVILGVRPVEGDAMWISGRRAASCGPCHRTILAVDMENSTGQPDGTKRWSRREMYRLFDQALRAAGITRRHRDPLVDRGDGILALIHPADHIPKTLLLSLVVPRLTASLRPTGLRLRAVAHAGEIHYDQDGCFGEALDISFRLLDAPEVKAQLRQSDEPLVLVVSDDIHRTIVRHSHPGIEENAFHPSVDLVVGGRRCRGWVRAGEPARGEWVSATRRLGVPPRLSTGDGSPGGARTPRTTGSAG